jgi:hypothetical protein
MAQAQALGSIPNTIPQKRQKGEGRGKDGRGKGHKVTRTPVRPGKGLMGKLPRSLGFLSFTASLPLPIQSLPHQKAFYLDFKIHASIKK